MIIYYENNRENTIGIDMTFINKTERDQASNLRAKTFKNSDSTQPCLSTEWKFLWIIKWINLWAALAEKYFILNDAKND